MADKLTYLFGGEEVALVVRPHPIVLVKPVLSVLAAVALLAGYPNEFTVLISFAVFLRFAWDAGLWWVDRYVLTTKRILSTAGIVSKNVISMPLMKITDLTYSRSVLGRLLGYGSMRLESAGEAGLERVDYLPDPDHFYRAVMSLALGPNSMAGMPQPQQPRPGGSPEERRDAVLANGRAHDEWVDQISRQQLED